MQARTGASHTFRLTYPQSDLLRPNGCYLGDLPTNQFEDGNLRLSLKRETGLLGAVLLGLGSMLGSGVFVCIGHIVKKGRLQEPPLIGENSLDFPLRALRVAQHFYRADVSMNCKAPP